LKPLGQSRALFGRALRVIALSDVLRSEVFDGPPGSAFRAL
jgi:hypothetical protein